MSFKNKVIVGCLSIMIIMTAYPPQIVKDYRFSGGNRMLTSENLEYHFIGEGGFRFGDTSEIAFDRLLLQYIIVAGAGYMIFLLKPKKEKQ